MAIIGSPVSINGVLIRLTDERWRHILLLHPNLENEAPATLRSRYLLPALRRERNPSEAERDSHSSANLRSQFSAKGDKQELVLKAVDKPSFIFKGRMGEFLAAFELSKRRFLVVVYREINGDGFVITAFETTDTRWLFKKELIWSNS